MVDVVIENGLIVDGTGAPPFRGTVLVEDGRLRVLRGRRPPERRGRRAHRCVRARRRARHRRPPYPLGRLEPLGSGRDQRDRAGRHDPDRRPVRLLRRPDHRRSLRTMVDEEPVFGFPDVDWSWRTIGGYLEAIDRVGIATNTVTLVGHSTLRRSVMGSDQRGPTPAELREMQDKLRQGIREGARGFSTGLSYAPGHVRDDRRADRADVGRRGGRAAVPHAHALRRVEHPRVTRGGDCDRRAFGRRAERLAPVPEPGRPGRRGRSADRDDRGRERPRHARHLGHHRVPARRRRMGAGTAAVGARRRHDRDAGAARRPRRAPADPRVPRARLGVRVGRAARTTS